MIVALSLSTARFFNRTLVWWIQLSSLQLLLSLLKVFGYFRSFQTCWEALEHTQIRSGANQWIYMHSRDAFGCIRTAFGRYGVLQSVCTILGRSGHWRIFYYSSKVFGHFRCSPPACSTAHFFNGGLDLKFKVMEQELFWQDQRKFLKSYKGKSFGSWQEVE